jgi:protein-S-isoprenylcysteine O-methyltransferase Ste14
MRHIDLPPVWLAGAIALAWWQSRTLTLGLSFGGAWADLLGGVLVGGGVLMMVLALSEFRRSKTTVHPHRDSSRLIQSGIFSRTRNPIYVGDVLILAGLILRFDAVLALPLLPVFVWVLEKRFIEREEKRLRRAFRMEYARYEQKVRRWV